MLANFHLFTRRPVRFAPRKGFRADQAARRVDLNRIVFFDIEMHIFVVFDQTHDTR